MLWKENYEKETNTYFPKATGSKSNTTYYYCNRSGYFNSKGKGKRKLKTQGTNKLNTYCTATITTKKDDNTGIITAAIHIMVMSYN